MIEFDVAGSSVVAKGEECRNRVKHLGVQLSAILGVDKGLVEILRPSSIPNGLKVHVNVHVVDDEEDNDMLQHFENLMNNAIISGQVQSSIRGCWELDEVPTISNLSVNAKDSKKKMRMTSLEGQLEMNQHDTALLTQLKMRRWNKKKMQMMMMMTKLHMLTQ